MSKKIPTRKFINIMKVSAVICAYNEEKTIAGVIKQVYQSSIVDEIIIVNDGSIDKTAAIIRQLGKEINLKFIDLPENKGKGYAMTTGVEQSTGEIIVFIDADLSDLHPKHIEKLIIPILNNEADIVLGLPTETIINYSINPFRSITGQRALLKVDIIPILDKIKTSRFGVETLINLFYKANGKKVKYTTLFGLKHSAKFQKTSIIKATRQFASMGQDIAITTYENYELVIKSLKTTLKNL